ALAHRGRPFAPNEAGVLRRLVRHIQIRCLQPSVALVAGLEYPVQDASRQERPLNRIGSSSAGKETLDLHHQRLQQGGAVWRRQIKERRDRLLFTRKAGGEGGIIDMPIEDQNGGMQTVAVL